MPCLDFVSFNKIDFVGDAAAQAACEATLKLQYPGCIVMSAKRPGDVANLHQTIVEFFQQDLVETEIFLPWSAQQLVGEIYATCKVLEERSDEEGTFYRVRGATQALDHIREQVQ